MSDKTKVGSESKIDITLKSIENTLISEYKANDSTIFKGKVNSYGNYDASLRTKLNENVALIFGCGGSVAGIVSQNGKDIVRTGLRVELSL